MKKLTKSFTREHSLFYVYIWDKSDIDAYNIKNVVFLAEENVVSVWYDEEELNGGIKKLVVRLNSDKNYVLEIIDKFEKYWGIVSPYLKNEKEIKNIWELEKYYKNMVSLWGAMALIVVGPDYKELDEKIKKDFLEIRKKSEKYTNNADKIFIEFFEKNYPEYKNLTYFITPKEVFSLKKKKLSEKKIEDIKERIKGYALLNDNLISLDGLDVELKRKGLEVEENKTILEKVYTRDTSLIKQEAWFYSLEQGLKNVFGWDNPNKIPTIYYLNDGTIEIWENKACTQWIMDKLLEVNKKDSNWLKKNIKKYSAMLDELSKTWDEGYVNGLKELESFIKKIFQSIPYFVVMYYSALDERTPKKVRNFAMSLRYQDVYFDKNDKVIRKSLLKIYPKLEGVENAVMKSELKSGIPDISVLKERTKHFIMIPTIDSKITTLEKFSKENPQYSFLIEEVEVKDVLKGQIAYNGKAKGIVKIIKRKSQVQEIKEGEILVTAMTTPDFVPAMKKASAIVTDEGGITCHAAITARELKKPCIIGTKIATRVLKDGMLVEVDAEKGIVRILEGK